MDSPITADQREGCIAELKRDNREDVFKKRFVAFIMLCSLYLVDCSWFEAAVKPESDRGRIILFCIALLAVCTCFIALSWVLSCWIVGRMRRHAGQVLTSTGLVNYVLALPSDVQAYHGRIRAALVGEWLTFKPERFDARRRTKAIITRFGTWCRRFHHLSEPWTVRMMLDALFCGSVCGISFLEWLVRQPFFRKLIGQSGYENPAAYWPVAGFVFLIGLWYAVVIARRVGSRMALIEYFEAEAARSDVMIAEHGASDG